MGDVTGTLMNMKPSIQSFGLFDAERFFEVERPNCEIRQPESLLKVSILDKSISMFINHEAAEL
jgi:hypothetical protein